MLGICALGEALGKLLFAAVHELCEKRKHSNNIGGFGLRVLKMAR